MAASTQAERVRASKLRKRIADGKRISDTDRAWLATYERTHGPGRKKAAVIDAASKPVPTAPRTVRGPQLAIAGTTEPAAPPTGAHVHETIADPGAAPAATETTWIPTVPLEVAEAPPAYDGAPPPPTAGTPLVDDATAGGGDPAAAQQFAKLVQFLTLLGMRAGRELAEDMDIPGELRALLASDELTAEALTTVGASAERLAMKWGFRSVPMGDEAIVVGAVLGSGALIAKNMKRKKLAEKKPAQGEHEAPKQREAKPTPLDALWED